MMAEAPNMAITTEEQMPAEAPAQEPEPGSSYVGLSLNASASS